MRRRISGWPGSIALALSLAAPAAAGDGVFAWTGPDERIHVAPEAPPGVEAFRLGTEATWQELRISRIAPQRDGNDLLCAGQLVLRLPDAPRGRQRHLSAAQNDRGDMPGLERAYQQAIRRQIEADRSPSSSADRGRYIAMRAREIERLQCKLEAIAAELAALDAENAPAYVVETPDGALEVTDVPPLGATARRLGSTRPAEALMIAALEPVERDGGVYCGSSRVFDTAGDPVVLLVNLHASIPNAEAWLAGQIARYQDRVAAQLEIDASPNIGGDVGGAIAEHARRIERTRCKLAWARPRLVALEPEGAAFVERAEQARAAFEEADTRCGPKPAIEGWTQDPAALDWARCLSRTRAERNEKLRAWKKHRALLDLLEAAPAAAAP